MRSGPEKCLLIIIIHDHAIYSTLCREFPVLILVGLAEAVAWTIALKICKIMIIALRHGPVIKSLFN